jgi:type I restriction enzyme, S subunit
MEVKAGYKHTEAGPLPVDWEVAPLGGFVRITSGASPSLFRFSASGIPYFKVEQLGNTEKYLGATDTPYLFERGDTVPEQSVLFAKRGAAIALNKVRILTQASFMDTNLMALTPQNGLECEYLYYALGHIGLWRFADTTSVPQINNKHVKPLPFPLPSLPEQRAIAAALRDVDALLGGLDRVIAKNRDLKRAVMQQLLSGQTRLPGFHGEWEVASLDMLTTRATGVWGANEPDERNTRLVEIIRAGDISQDGRLTATATRYVAPQEFEKAKCTLDDLVITASGNGLGKVWWCDGRSNIAASNFVRVLHPKARKVVGKFLYYALRTEEGLRQLQEHTATSAYPNLRPTYFSTAWIPLPLPPEQNAIAAVLADMDVALSALEARRDKTRALKQGMMQELLTGRTRLV